VEDVLEAEQEVHVLTPTRYVEPGKRNEEAVEKNARLSFQG
jgi:hypothetical protein